MCIAVGNVSFDDCDMLTWSLGWTGFFEPISPPAISIARLEITSLTFMFVCVPLPVCQTRSGKCASSLPATTSSAAWTIRSVFSVVELAEIVVDQRGGLLERRHRFDDLLGHHVARPHAVADVEVDERARRLRAVVLVGGDIDLAHRVGLDARLRGAVLGRRMCSGHSLAIFARGGGNLPGLMSGGAGNWAPGATLRGCSRRGPNRAAHVSDHSSSRLVPRGRLGPALRSLPAVLHAEVRPGRLHPVFARARREGRVRGAGRVRWRDAGRLLAALSALFVLVRAAPVVLERPVRRRSLSRARYRKEPSRRARSSARRPAAARFWSRFRFRNHIWRSSTAISGSLATRFSNSTGCFS